MQDNRHILTVSELNAEVNLLLTQGFPLIWLEGEISNLARPASGHLYFSLKDPKAQVRCAMFRNNNMRMKLKPENGQKVLVRARIGLYEPRGEFQLVVEHMEDAGEGLLQKQYEALKKKLMLEGLFDKNHKQSFPVHPQHIGIISSPTGAAVRDILNVLKRRCPHIPVRLYPVAVQGDASVPQILKALEQAEYDAICDVLIIARGGGSIEDLWSFNDEHVARAIADCPVPIISGIGHEIDFTIADFVADKRAPTPSAAAELISPDREELLQTLDRYELRLQQHMLQQLKEQSEKTNWLNRQLQQQHPLKRIQQQDEKRQQHTKRLNQMMELHITQAAQQLEKTQIRLHNQTPDKHLQQKQQRLSYLQEKLQNLTEKQQNQSQQQLRLLASRLHSISPLATLERGYSITQTLENATITSVTQVKQGQTIKTKLKDGEITSTAQ
jgi:exodeoxyribonuclease VII large subunit